MIKVYENVLEDHVALGIHEYIKNVSWKHNYPSAPNKPDRHWHVLCGADGDLFFMIWYAISGIYDDILFNRECSSHESTEVIR